MFVDNDKKIICLSVPKSGTTSVANFFKDKISGDSVVWLYPESAQIRHSTLTDLIDKSTIINPISDYKVYGVCRNPGERLISCVDYFTSRLNETAIKVINNEEERKAEILERMKLMFVDMGMEKFILNDEGRPSGFDMQLIFYRRQSDFLKYNDQVINHIYKYENLSSMVSDIAANYGIDASGFENTERFNERTTTMTWADVPEETQVKINEYYAEDIELYNSL